MEDQRLDRRALLRRATAAGATLALPTWAVDRAAQAATPSRPGRVPRPGGGRSLKDLARAVRGRVITRGSRGYATAAEVYNERYDGARPLAIVEARGASDVREAVRWAERRDVHVVPRSGGHSYAGYSTGDGVLVIDLGRLRGVRVNRRRGTATVGPGTQLIDVYAGLARRGVTIPGGSCPTVGIGGLALGGGYGLASRKLGLTCDVVRGVSIVTADGRLLDADKRRNRDLFWASRGGGGGNFGVVTSFEFRVHRARRGAWFFIRWPWSRAADALDAWQRFAPAASDELTALFHLQTGRGSPTATAVGQLFGSESELRRLLAPLRAVDGANVSVGSSSYLDLMRRWAGCLDQSVRSCHVEGTQPGATLQRARFVAASDYVDSRLSGKARKAMVRAIERRQNESGSGALLMDAYGGAINRVGARETAFVHRDALFSIQYASYYPASDGPRASQAWIDSTRKSLRRDVSGMAYQNYIDPTLRDWQHAYYGANYRRLRRIKERYDPDRRFDFPQAIRPA